MIVEHGKREDSEIKLLEVNEQLVVMMLKPGGFDFGFRSTSITRLSYQTNAVFLAPRHRPIWVRGIEPDYMTITISDAMLSSASENPTVVELQCRKVVKDERVRALMMAINAERLAGFPSGRLFLESIEIAMASALIDRHVAQGQSARKPRSGPTPVRLRRVLDLIKANLQRDLPVQEMANVAGLSVWHFSQMFRKTTGTSPHRFLLEQMLQRKDVKILEVAFACGFKTQQHFARAFRRAYSVSPTEYKRLRQQAGKF